MRTKPLFSVCVFLSLSMFPAGCTKSDDGPKRADRARADLMPAAAPQFDATYLANQRQVKVLAEREISGEPPETFQRSAPRSREPQLAARPAAKESAAAPARGPVTRGPAPAGGGGFWGKLAMKAAGAASGDSPMPGAAEQTDVDDADADDEAGEDLDDEGEDGSDDEEKDID